MTKRQFVRAAFAILIWLLLLGGYFSLARIVPIDFVQGTIPPSDWIWRRMLGYFVYGALFLSLPVSTLWFFPNLRLGRIALAVLWIMYLLVVPALALSFIQPGGLMSAFGFLLLASVPYQLILYLFALIAVVVVYALGERRGFFVGAFLFMFAWLFPVIPLYTFPGLQHHSALSEDIVQLQRRLDLRCPTSMDISQQPSLFAKCQGFTQEKQTGLAFMNLDRATFILVTRQLIQDIPVTEGEYKRRAIFALQEQQGKSLEFDQLLRGDLSSEVLGLICHYPFDELDPDLETVIYMILAFYNESPGLPVDCPIRSRIYFPG